MDLGLCDTIGAFSIHVDIVAALNSNDLITIGYFSPLRSNNSTYFVVPFIRRISLKPPVGAVIFIFEDIQSLIHCLDEDA